MDSIFILNPKTKVKTQPNYNFHKNNIFHVYLESGRISILIITWFWMIIWLQHGGAQVDV